MTANKHAADKQRLAELNHLEQALNDSYCRLGESVLDLAEQEIRSIHRLMEDIIRLRQELAGPEAEADSPKKIETAAGRQGDQNGQR